MHEVVKKNFSVGCYFLYRFGIAVAIINSFSDTAINKHTQNTLTLKPFETQNMATSERSSR